MVGFVQNLSSAEEIQEKRALALTSLRQLEEYVGISKDESAQSEVFLKGPANAS